MFERLANNKIREAMEQGEFDNLPNRGKPIDLEEYFKTPAELRLAHSILKSASCLPEEVERLNEVAALERQVAGATDETSKRELTRLLSDARLRLDLCLERSRRK